jgi:hypothetical protein
MAKGGLFMGFWTWICSSHRIECVGEGAAQTNDGECVREYFLEGAKVEGAADARPAPSGHQWRMAGLFMGFWTGICSSHRIEYVAGSAAQTNDVDCVSEYFPGGEEGRWWKVGGC